MFISNYERTKEPMNNVNKMTTVADFAVSVVLPASGSGERFGHYPPKQFSVLLDEPLIFHTFSTFQRIPWIQQIVVPVGCDFIKDVEQLVEKHNLDKVKVVKGCTTRHRSIYAGVKALTKVEGDHVVIIHDVVRLFTEESIIRQVTQAARLHGSAGVYRPLVSTVIAVDGDNFLQESLDRRLYRASEMPQAFSFDIINTAYQKATEFDFEHGTECLLLAMKYTGTKAKLIEGPDSLWKVTYKKDIYAAEGMLKEQHLRVLVVSESDSEQNGLKAALVTKCAQKNIKHLIHATDCTDIDRQCNSYVYIYKHFDKHKLSLNTDTSWSARISGSDIYIAPCIIHVCYGEQLKGEERYSYIETCHDLAKQYKHAVVYGIINEDADNREKVSEMVANAVWNRDRSLSGQTFIVTI